MVVILGVSETGLGAMRSLGKRGFVCWGVDARFDHPGFSSRYCQRRVCVSEYVSAPELAAVLAEIARSGRRRGRCSCPPRTGSCDS